MSEIDIIDPTIAIIRLPEASRYDLPAGYRRGAFVARGQNANYVIRNRDGGHVVAEWHPDHAKMPKRKVKAAIDAGIAATYPTA